MIKISEDTYMHKGMRKKLIDSLRSKGIKDEAILAAFDAVPRHYFLDSALVKIAYEDRAFPIAAGQTISQPYTVAFQTELLELKKYDKVLEVGTGSAYQASILAELKAQVYSIERQKDLFFDGKKNIYPFKSKYPMLKFFLGDGYKGLPKDAPFDKILVTAGAPEIPQVLIDQLKPNGFLVAPIGPLEKQMMTRIVKGPRGGIKKEEYGYFSFVPMLKGINQKK